jgi:hypothetical protein
MDFSIKMSLTEDIPLLERHLGLYVIYFLCGCPENLAYLPIPGLTTIFETCLGAVNLGKTQF